MDKKLLKEAWEAGVRSVDQNKDREYRLDRGSKQIEQEYDFENWYVNKEISAPTTKYCFEKSASTANNIIEGYSELLRLNKNPIGAAQLLNAMEKYHNKMKEYESPE